MKRPKRPPVRPTLAHAVMVLAGLATFVLVTATLRDRGSTVEVFVAADPVEAGTPIDGAPLDTIAVGSDSALLPSLVRSGPLEPGLAVARRLQPGEPLLQADLVPTDGGSALRTVALPVERLVIDGLGLRIGDRIDVIGVATDGTPRFVAVDVGVARLPADAALGLGRTADTATTWLTVSVTDGQALDLAAATARGTVVVARSTGATPVGAHASSAAVPGGPRSTAAGAGAGAGADPGAGDGDGGAPTGPEGPEGSTGSDTDGDGGA